MRNYDRSNLNAGSEVRRLLWISSQPTSTVNSPNQNIWEVLATVDISGTNLFYERDQHNFETGAPLARWSYLQVNNFSSLLVSNLNMYHHL